MFGLNMPTGQSLLLMLASSSLCLLFHAVKLLVFVGHFFPTACHQDDDMDFHS